MASAADQPKVRVATIKQVAQEAGVSTATVSRVLSGLNGAGPKVKNRVLAVARKLNYQPNRSAQILRSRKRKLIGAVIPDLQNPFFTGIVQGVEEVLHEAGYTLFLANSDEVSKREAHEIRALQAEGVAGLILIPCNPDPGHYAGILNTGLSVVAVDRVPGGCDVDLVKTANADGAEAAVSHLVKLGCRKIAIINGPKHYDVATERLEGFRKALGSIGTRNSKDWEQHGDFRVDGGHDAARLVLESARRPDALFVTNYLMTLGALQAIHELKLRIPEDIAIVGFDDMPWAISLNPPLTAVAQPTRDLGRTAAQLLLERIENPDRPVRKVILQPTLKVRASCGSMLKQSKNLS